MVIETRDGGIDVLTLSSSGDFVRDLDALASYMQGGRDVDQLTKEEFDALVERHRAWIG